MGLDTTHNCWHGSYSWFMKWREAVAEAAGMPPLKEMKGFDGDTRWEDLAPSPLNLLLNHSDCDGELRWQDCNAIADALEAVSPKLADDYWREKANQFVAGLRSAAKAKENVEFR